MKKCHQTRWRDWHDLNQFTCRYVGTEKYTELSGKKLYLRSGDGMLYFGDYKSMSVEERRKHLLYYPEGSEQGIELPMERWEVNQHLIAYSEARDEYLLFGTEVEPGHSTSWPEGKPRPYWILKPKTGEIAAHELLASEWSKSDNKSQYTKQFQKHYLSQRAEDMVLTREGLLWEGRTYDRMATINPYSYQIWLKRDDVIEKVFGHLVGSKKVSPNGCRLAVTSGALKVIDICNNND